MTSLRLHAVALAATLITSAIPAMAQTYGNTANGSVFDFGFPNTTAYGETFTSPGGTLNDWQFAFNQSLGPGGNFEFVIASWNGSYAVGPALYQAAGYYSGSGYQLEDFSGIGTSLTAGQQYVAYFTVSGVSNPILESSETFMESGAGNGGLPGNWVFINSSGVDPLTLTNNWFNVVNNNLYYSATFGPSVSEPASLAALGTGLIALGLMRRRRAA